MKRFVLFALLLCARSSSVFAQENLVPTFVLPSEERILLPAAYAQARVAVYPTGGFAVVLEAPPVAGEQSRVSTRGFRIARLNNDGTQRWIRPLAGVTDTTLPSVRVWIGPREQLWVSLNAEEGSTHLTQLRVLDPEGSELARATFRAPQWVSLTSLSWANDGSAILGGYCIHQCELPHGRTLRGAYDLSFIASFASDLSRINWLTPIEGVPDLSAMQLLSDGSILTASIHARAVRAGTLRLAAIPPGANYRPIFFLLDARGTPRTMQAYAPERNSAESSRLQLLSGTGAAWWLRWRDGSFRRGVLNEDLHQLSFQPLRGEMQTHQALEGASNALAIGGTTNEWLVPTYTSVVPSQTDSIIAQWRVLRWDGTTTQTLHTIALSARWDLQPVASYRSNEGLHIVANVRDFRGTSPATERLVVLQIPTRAGAQLQLRPTETNSAVPACENRTPPGAVADAVYRMFALCRSAPSNETITLTFDAEGRPGIPTTEGLQNPSTQCFNEHLSLLRGCRSTDRTLVAMSYRVALEAMPARRPSAQHNGSNTSTATTRPVVPSRQR